MESPAPMTGADAVVDVLVKRGVSTLFGLPGVQLDPLFNAFYDARSRLRVINARHEQGVAYMALGFAQATGRPGVYACVPGPGFLNTTAALSTAYANHAPVLALIGQVATDEISAGHGVLHELPDQTAIVRGLTRWSGLALSADDAPRLLSSAFARLDLGRGPVAVELPADVLRSPLTCNDTRETETLDPQPVDPLAVAEAVRLLEGANRPMIVVGSGAVDAGDDLRAIAERLGAPVVSHLQGRGILDSRHLLSVGRPEAVRMWRDVDVILAVGTRFSSPRRRWGLGQEQRVVRIDFDPAQFRRGAPPDVAILADARAALAALAAGLGVKSLHAPARAQWIAKVKAEVAAEFGRSLAPQMSFLRAIREATPEDTVFVADYTQVGYVATTALPVHVPRQMITPGYQGTLGFAFATALGAKVGCPDKPVVALCGDGGFLFTASELATAVQHDIRTVTIVFNDGGYGNVRRMQQDLYGGRVIASDLKNPDFVGFAESFGAAARRAEGPQALSEALRWAFDQQRPVIIDAPVDKMPDPWDLLEPDGPNPGAVSRADTRV
jgi:acetolactate synthase I/II/III large subunit